jgi:hypothetical protein
MGGWIWCVHMNVNGKMIPVETISGMGDREDKGEWWREWMQEKSKKFLKCHNVSPPSRTIKIREKETMNMEKKWKTGL